MSSTTKDATLGGVASAQQTTTDSESTASAAWAIGADGVWRNRATGKTRAEEMADPRAPAAKAPAEESAPAPAPAPASKATPREEESTSAADNGGQAFIGISEVEVDADHLAALFGSASHNTSVQGNIITYGAGDLSSVATAAWFVLLGVNEGAETPRVMVRGTELVRMTERGELEPYDKDSLKDELSRVATFEQHTAKGPCKRVPRSDVVDALLARDSADYVGGPRVDRVVDVPVVSADGEIIDQPGYHAASRLFYRPASGLFIPPLPDLSDYYAPDEVYAARDYLLDNYLGDFAWEREDGELTANGKASRANALAAMLTLFTREYIGAAPTPLFTFLANQKGMGKGTAIRTLTVPACGEPSMMAQPKSDEEMEKRITALLVAGRPAVVLDNVATAINSPALAAMLTAPTWEGRILGHSRMVVVPNRTVWFASGNNMRVSSELADRCCPIILDCGDDIVPRHRDKSAFRHTDIVAYGVEHRGELVRACLTLIQHYLEGTYEVSENGLRFHRHRYTHEDEHVQLVGTDRTMGSFERWADVTGGILAAAGVEGFLGNRDAFMDEADDEGAELASFFKAWNELGAAFTLDELVKACRFSGGLEKDLPMALVDVRDDEMKSALTYWLREHKGQHHGGFQLVGERVDAKNNRKRWRVRQLHS